MRLFLASALAIAGCASDEAKIEIRVCNATGMTITSLSWGRMSHGPLDALECTEYRTTTADVCDETSIGFTAAGERYATYRTDCYEGDYGVSEGRWSIHVRIGDTQFHSVAVTVLRD